MTFPVIVKLPFQFIYSLPIVAFAIFGMANWCYRWYREDGEVAIEDVAQLLIALFFNGVLNTAEVKK